MGKLQFGISSMNLGSSVKERPDAGIIEKQWEDAVVIDRFYRAGGNPLPASPTECRFLWDEEALYVLFFCREEKKSPVWTAGRTKADEWLPRRDEIDLAIRGEDFGNRDFLVFSANKEGKVQASLQKGMTYIGGDVSYSADPDRQNRAVITQIKEERYFYSLKEDKEGWRVFFAIPWELLGGVPKERFALQVYRRKFQTSEVGCPYPLDLNVNYSDRFEYDPLTFIETGLNGSAGTGCGEGILFSLPGGVLRWQRPAVLEWTTDQEREEINCLLQDGAATDPKNIADRVRLVQRWQDTLTLEGMDFFFNQAIANPWEIKEPWLVRRLCNEAFLQGRTEAACRELDGYLMFLRRVTQWWYGDHTLGNRSREGWYEPEVLLQVKQSVNGADFVFQSGFGIWELHFQANSGGFRFYGEQEGFFRGEACRDRTANWDESVDLTVVPAGGEDVFWLEASVGTLLVRTGQEWYIREEKGRFCLDRASLRLFWEENHQAAFEWQQGLEAQDQVYGFGERFDAFSQRGRILTLWQRDACEGCLASIGNQSYKNIPLFHHTAGYSVFINSFERIRADIGREQEKRMRITVCGPVLDFWIWCCEPWKALQNYMKLTGNPILPPKWVFEPWAGGGAGRWLHGPLNNLCREQKAVLERFAWLDIPHSGFYAEGAGVDWWGEPKKEELYEIVALAREQGIRVFSWQYPNMTAQKAAKWLPQLNAEELPVTKEASDRDREKGFGREAGDKKLLPVYIDFTHPNAMELLRAQWKVRLDAGIRGSMVDFGETLPDEALFYDGRMGKELHNGYAYEYARSYRRLFEERYGDDHVLFMRSACAGSQAYACQFGGDQLASFVGMTYAIAGGLTAAASGLPFWGVDAGGYDGMGDVETYSRWTEYACFCPIMRFHGTAPREPWEYGEEAVRIYKFYAWLRENLLDYSYHCAIEAHKKGIPMMRPLVMEFPEEGLKVACGDEYLYGRDLLVAPVHQESCSRQISFPKGRWLSLWDNQEIVQGPAVCQKEIALDKIAVYIREGAFAMLALNGSLTPGESMSCGRRSVLLISDLQGRREGVWYRSETDAAHYSLEGNEEALEAVCEGTEALEYLLVKGLQDGIRQVIVNGRSLKEQPAKHGLYFEEGWFREKDGTVIIRVWKYGSIHLRICREQKR